MGCGLAVPIHYCDPQDPAEFISAVKILAPWMEVKRRQRGGRIDPVRHQARGLYHFFPQGILTPRNF
jgi:hypothetical protein